MRYIHYIVVFSLISVLIAACSITTRSLPTADQLAKYQGADIKVDLTVLSRGRSLAVTNCAGCHRFFYPEEYSNGEWPEIVRDMGKGSSLNSEQIKDVMYYFDVASSTVR